MTPKKIDELAKSLAEDVEECERKRGFTARIVSYAGMPSTIPHFGAMQHITRLLSLFNLFPMVAWMTTSMNA